MYDDDWNYCQWLICCFTPCHLSNGLRKWIKIVQNFLIFPINYSYWFFVFILILALPIGKGKIFQLNSLYFLVHSIYHYVFRLTVYFDNYFFFFFLTFWPKFLPFDLDTLCWLSLSKLTLLILILANLFFIPRFTPFLCNKFMEHLYKLFDFLFFSFFSFF